MNLLEEALSAQEKKIDSDLATEREREQRESLHAELEKVSDHESLSESPPKEKPPSSWYSSVVDRVSGEAYQKELRLEEKHAADRLRKVESLGHAMADLQEEYQRERELAAARHAAAADAVNHNARSKNGWTWWR